MPKSSHSRIQAITFDVGGTLIQPWPSVGHIYAEAALKYGGKRISADVLKQRFVTAWAALDHFNHTRAEWAALVDETFRGITEEPPSQTFFPELYEYFAQPSAWRIFDDALPALDALASRDLKLGVISNWDERLRPLLQELRLADYFDAMVISCEVGFPKPSRIIFETAAEKLALPAECLLHVGDSAAHDFEGARRAGFEALLLDRIGTIGEAGTITSLAEIDSFAGQNAGSVPK